MCLAQIPWSLLAKAPSAPPTAARWLPQLLARNVGTAYLREFGTPRTLKEFRSQVPVCTYEDLKPYLQRLQDGEGDVLFAGHPVAYERTSGSTSDPKLIPYSQEGLRDFQLNILPWLAHTAVRYKISGSTYFSISPATRQPEFIGKVPVGLPDAAYLGEHAGRILAEHSAVPLEVGGIADMDEWRKATIQHLVAAKDLELISVWSPTFLLSLLENIPDAKEHWPRLKLVSCWASGHSRDYARQLQRLLPQAEIQPKGLLSTEAVITVPDESSRPILVRHGFVEFAQGDAFFMEDELITGDVYEVVATTASGLYRYRTGDCVVYAGQNAQGRHILEFVGRDSLTSDLVGEKLNEIFIAQCLEVISGFSMLVPDVQLPGYVLVCDQLPTADQILLLKYRLQTNPQYAYALELGQLAPLRVLAHPSAALAYERLMLDRGSRLGDVKPAALRREAFWLPYFEETLQ